VAPAACLCGEGRGLAQSTRGSELGSHAIRTLLGLRYVKFLVHVRLAQPVPGQGRDERVRRNERRGPSYDGGGPHLPVRQKQQHQEK
jgi:hypothetical protein